MGNVYLNFLQLTTKNGLNKREGTSSIHYSHPSAVIAEIGFISHMDKSKSELPLPLPIGLGCLSTSLVTTLARNTI